jgi:hypothetical protein
MRVTLRRNLIARIIRGAGLLVCLLVLAASSLQAQALSPAWVELGDGGQAIARIVVSGPRDCPSIQIDGTSRPTELREPMPDGLRPVCQAKIPSGARSAVLNGQALAIPRLNPSRVIVIGDTG